MSYIFGKALIVIFSFFFSGHSRVGLRRTGDVEGVQSVGNWQSRVNQGELPAWVKRVFVKPIGANLAKAYHHRRTCLADHEVTFFNKELKKRLPSDPGVVSISLSASLIILLNSICCSQLFSLSI